MSARGSQGQKVFNFKINKYGSKNEIEKTIFFTQN